MESKVGVRQHSPIGKGLGILPSNKKGWNYLNEEEHWSVYLIALPGKRPPEGIFCYESIKVVQYNNYLIGGETQGFLNYIFRLGGGGALFVMN